MEYSFTTIAIVELFRELKLIDENSAVVAEEHHESGLSQRVGFHRSIHIRSITCDNIVEADSLFSFKDSESLCCEIDSLLPRIMWFDSTRRQFFRFPTFPFSLSLL
jgi:hypothetical protein